VPGAAPSIGNLTTGNWIANTFLHTRTFNTTMGMDEYFSKTVDRASVELAKNLNSVVKQTDGTYNLDFTFQVKNNGLKKIEALLVSDNLQSVFPSGVGIKVLNVFSTGNLLLNTNYTGMGIDTNLLVSNSTLEPGNTDTIRLIINANFQKISGLFFNTAIAKATIHLGSTAANEALAFSSNGLDPDAPVNPTPIEIAAPANGIFIPGGFSPNQDGINDYFVLGNTINYNVKLEVFNRWGNKVYESTGYYQNNWDGKSNQANTFANNELVDGTYFYIIQVFDKISGELVQKPIGFITIKRD
jgi:gliding motility-associated-like protein